MSKDALDKFTSSSLRGSKGIYQQLQASALAKSVQSNDKLVKTASICEAAMGSKTKDKLDMNLIDICWIVSDSFSKTHPENKKPHLMRVAWGFPQNEENWRKYIKPWQRIRPNYYPLETPYRYSNHPPKPRYSTKSGLWWEVNEEKNEYLDNLDELQEYISKKINEMPEYEIFYHVSDSLSCHSFQKIQSEFTTWALKQLLEVRKELASEIDPKVWREALGQKEKEAKEETDENE